MQVGCQELFLLLLRNIKSARHILAEGDESYEYKVFFSILLVFVSALFRLHGTAAALPANCFDPASFFKISSAAICLYPVPSSHEVMFSLFRGNLFAKQGGILLSKENKQLAPKKESGKSSIDYTDFVDSCSNTVVSGTECTGLIPTPPESEPESEAYSDLYTIPKPDAEQKKKPFNKAGKG